MGERLNTRGEEAIDALLANPAWVPHRILENGRTIQLIHLSVSQQQTLPFLDERYVSNAAERRNVRVSDVLHSIPSEQAHSCHYIFHSAFCCSTLLSRALDIDGVASVFKEPQALIDLVDLLPESGWPTDQQRTLEAVLNLLQRSRRTGEKTVIKPSNFANRLIEHLLDLRSDSRALLMYASLPAFLYSVARGRRWSWARSMIRIYRRNPEFATNQVTDLLLLTDFQIAAFLWLQQQAHFARIVRKLPRRRVATLRADVFLAQPARALVGAAALFDLALNEDEATEIVAGTIFQKHSKSADQAFDQSVRKREDILLKLAFGSEIEQAAEWAERVADEASIPLDLSSSLIG